MIKNGLSVTGPGPLLPGVLWSIIVDTRRPLVHMPRLINLASERRDHTHGYHYEGRRRPTETQFLFKYTLSGEGRFRDQDGERAVPPGHGFLCEVCDPETAYFYPPASRKPWEFFFACFKWPAGRNAVLELIERYGPLHALPPDSGVIAKLLAWRHYRHRRLEIDPGASAAMVMDLLAALVSAREASRPDDPMARLIRDAQKLIHDGIAKPLTVAGLAQTLAVSREHLSRVFHEQTGQTPSAYILRQKMAIACRQLKDSDLSIAEIAAQVGYTDSAHFVRRFKGLLHLPPGRFRKVGVVPLW